MNYMNFYGMAEFSFRNTNKLRRGYCFSAWGAVRYATQDSFPYRTMRCGQLDTKGGWNWY